MPKPSAEAKAAFHKLVPSDPAVASRPMFGNLAAFVNGNMFCGLFGEDLFVRVSAEDGELSVDVADDGSGFDTRTVARSGLSGLEDRIEALGGSLLVTSTPGTGTRLTVRLPVPSVTRV